ncbi:L-2-amino-thiazoline-4-carboxylic acid hydrolase [Aestuariivirga sp.]|uniref:L-2-amino-thiazoline-4-carboxylic acid hydrolase n=1 Tax=Aestuariivirga sp. TaxID=2650926 RepID=UPI0039E69995
MKKPDGHAMWRALNDANKARALVYVEFFRAMERRFGHEVAVQVTREAVYNWGRTLSGDLGTHLPSDFAGLCQSFAYAPDGGAMFTPDVESCSEEGLNVQFMTCPLKSAWIEAGLSDQEVALFCSMAACADYGTLEGVGYKVDIKTWQPGGEGCCSLSISIPDAHRR